MAAIGLGVTGVSVTFDEDGVHFLTCNYSDDIMQVAMDPLLAIPYCLSLPLGMMIRGACTAKINPTHALP